MNPKLAYKFCPKCGGIIDLKRDNLLVCKACGFEFFINAIPCNGVIIENERGEIMLVKRKFPPMKGDWDWPGGFLDAGESVNHSIVREIKEELNVNVSVEKIIGVYEGRYEFGGILQYVICIVVSAKIVSGKIKVSDDVEEYKFFLPEEILRMDLAFKFIRRGIADYFKNP